MEDKPQNPITLKIDEIWWEGPEDNEDTLCIRAVDGTVYKMYKAYPTSITWPGLDMEENDTIIISEDSRRKY